MKKHLFLALAAFAFSSAASAQAYGLVSAGVSRHDIDCSGASTCDKSGSAFKLFGGYKFMPNIAGEVGYFDFGKAKASAPGISGSLKVNGFGLGAAFHGDFAPNWTGVARLGVGQVKTKIDGTIAGLGSASDSDTNTSLYGGLGVGYRLSPTMTIDGAWDFTRSKYDKNGVDESGNVNAFSVGLTFSF